MILGCQIILLCHDEVSKISAEKVDTGIVKKLGKFPYWDKKLSYEKNTCIPK